MTLSGRVAQLLISLAQPRHKGAPSLVFQGREAILLAQLLNRSIVLTFPLPVLRKVREERGTGCRMKSCAAMPNAV